MKHVKNAIIFVIIAVLVLGMAACAPSESVDSSAADENAEVATENIASEEGTEDAAPETPEVSAESAEVNEAEANVNDATTSALVEVDSGWLLGTKEFGVYSFLGIPYATAERFMMPQKVESWEGLRAATVYGETCPNGATTMNVTDYMTKNQAYMANENCLYLNIWSPSVDSAANKSVVVFLHGGGFSSGASNELTYYEGQSMAGAQDVVFVSMNSRLNVLGFTDLSAYGDDYKYSGNVGMADLVAALEWVNTNVAQFGGDPSNVTIVGQSGGGSKVSSLMGMPSAQGLFSKAGIFSGGGPIGQTTQDTQGYGTALVEKAKETYGVATDEEALDKLKTISYDELYALSQDTGVGGGLTVDGDLIPASPISQEDGSWADIAKEIPLIVSTTIAEFSGNMADFCISQVVNNVTPYVPDAQENYIPSINKSLMSAEAKQAKLEEMFGEDAESVVAEFQKAYPEHDPFNAFYTSKRSNDQAIGKASQGGAPVYQCVFSWEFPCFGGSLAWHTGGDLPFVLNNVDMIDYLIAGNEDEAYYIGDMASTALANFAKTGDPSQEGLDWPAFTAENGETMIFDSTCEVKNYHDKELMSIFPEPEMPF